MSSWALAQKTNVNPFTDKKPKSAEEMIEDEMSDTEDGQAESAEVAEEDPDDFEPIDEVTPAQKPKVVQKKPPPPVIPKEEAQLEPLFTETPPEPEAPRPIEYAKPVREPEPLQLPPLDPEVEVSKRDPEVVYTPERDQEPAQKQEASFRVGSVNVGGPEKSIMVPHPNAAKGLTKIRQDGSYIYKVKTRDTTKASTINFTALIAPDISRIVNGNTITFESMYGNSLYGITANFEWLPFRRFGTIGFVFESGFSIARGTGKFRDGSDALEEYSMIVVPLSVFAKYRFIYSKRQLFVPYVYGGGTYYAFNELRDDGQNFRAGAVAVGGGGGIQLNMTRVDPESALRLGRDFGIGDMWLTADGRFLQGLSETINMTNLIISLGMTLDY